MVNSEYELRKIGITGSLYTMEEVYGRLHKDTIDKLKSKLKRPEKSETVDPNQITPEDMTQ